MVQAVVKHGYIEFSMKVQVLIITIYNIEFLKKISSFVLVRQFSHVRSNVLSGDLVGPA